MMSRRQTWLGALVLTAVLGLFGGCGIEMAPEGRLAGQECFADGECVEGTRCLERRCRPLLGTGESVDEEGSQEESASEEQDEVIVEPFDSCEPGLRGCHQGAPWDCRDGTWSPSGEVCVDGSQCQDGACVGEDDEEEDETCDP